MYHIKYRDLSVSKEDRQELLTSIDTVLSHGQFISGPETEDLETKLSEYLNARYVIGVSSGTDSLILALMALNIGQDDEVITSAMSFVATANAIEMVGAIPVFADIDADFNISCDSIKSLISKKTKAILPVHYGGKIANMKQINMLAKDNGLHVIEDASQAFGAQQNNHFSGTMSTIGCISLNPMKVLAALGEAGIVITNDQKIYEKLRLLRYNGVLPGKSCQLKGFNARLDTIQAAILLPRLKKIEKTIKRGIEIAEFYTQHLNEVVNVPKNDPLGRRVYYTYSVITQDRDSLKAFLEEASIETKIYHTAIPDEPAYKNAKGLFSNAQTLSKTKLAIPCHEKMTNQEVEYITNRILQFFNH
jgi:dTDP-4-amino-4,6-dideoxygalactose transaminase